MDVGQLREVIPDLDGVLIAYYRDGSHSIWKPRFNTIAGNVSIDIVACGPVCAHKRPRDSSNSSNDEPKKKEPRRSVSLTCTDEITSLLFKVFRDKLASGFSVKPLDERYKLDIEAELEACKEQCSESSPYSQSSFLERWEGKKNEYRLVFAVLRHLLLCTDICLNGWDLNNLRNLKLGDKQKRELFKVKTRHSIVAAALEEMVAAESVDEPLALAMLVGLADSGCVFSNLWKASYAIQDKVAAKFARKALPKIERHHRGSDQMWYIHPVRFASWLSDKPAEECRRILLLDDFDLLGCSPCATVQHVRQSTVGANMPVPAAIAPAPPADHETIQRGAAPDLVAVPDLARQNNVVESCGPASVPPMGTAGPGRGLPSALSQVLDTPQTRGNSDDGDQSPPMWESSVAAYRHESGTQHTASAKADDFPAFHTAPHRAESAESTRSPPASNLRDIGSPVEDGDTPTTVVQWWEVSAGKTSETVAHPNSTIHEPSQNQDETHETLVMTGATMVPATRESYDSVDVDQGDEPLPVVDITSTQPPHSLLALQSPTSQARTPGVQQEPCSQHAVSFNTGKAQFPGSAQRLTCADAGLTSFFPLNADDMAGGGFDTIQGSEPSIINQSLSDTLGIDAESWDKVDWLGAFDFDENGNFLSTEST